ncbi:MAG: site-specific integrase [Planctomycetota bacterium]
MIKREPKVPSYRLHKPSGQGVVTLNGTDHYLGEHGTAESRERYNELVSRWLANGRQLSHITARLALSVNELILAYYRQCEERYGHRKTKSTRLSQIRSAMQPVKQMYGSMPAVEFGPKALLLVRQVYVAGGWERRTQRNGKPILVRAKPWARKTVNDHIQLVKRMFRWAVQEELLPASAWQALSAVEGLRSGESSAADTRKVWPVPDEYVDAILKHVLPPVRAMIELQRLTGMRPGEVTIMRGRDLDTSGEHWIYRPSHHKSEHRGHDREIAIGHRGQEVVRAFLRTNVDQYLFRPDEAEAARDAERRRKRRTKLWPGHLRRLDRIRSQMPKRAPGDHYQVGSYAQTIMRACKLAGVPHWHPHQLRHNYATRIRKEFGIEAARILLGHRSTAVTELYAEVDRGRVREIVSKVG